MRPPRRRSGADFALTALAAALVVLALAADAFARGGGGGNFPGGGGGGGGGGGDDGLGALIYLLIELVFRVPWLGIPLTILVIVVVVRKGRDARIGYQATVIRGGMNASAALRGVDLVAQVRAADPAFDPAAFDARVRTAFRKVQDAWCAQDLTAIRPFVSDGVHERFAMQIGEERALGYRDRMDALAIDGTRLAFVGSEGGFDVVTVRIAATAADYRVSLATGGRVSGDTRPTQFVEFWTFLRRKGAKAPAPGAGLIEGNCPNCGDALAGNQFADCASCHAHLRNGEHDWVLVEITQAGEWAPRAPGLIPGVAALREADPDFSAAAMEDRASVAFWRWAQAMRTGDASVLAGVAADEVVRATAASAAGTDGTRRWIGECGVGSVSLIGVLREGEVHRAVVEVRWAGTEFMALGAAPARRMERTGILTWLFVYERAAAVKTAVSHQFASAHCRGCGAPAEGAATVCAYCSAPLADVNLGWTLVRMTTTYDAAGRVLLASLRGAEATADATLPRAAAAPTSAGVLTWAARVAASDGIVDRRELAALATLARRAHIDETRLDEIVRDALAPRGEPDLPGTVVEARAWLDVAVRAALADGVVSPAESALLTRLGARAELSAADVRLAVSRTRATMYQEAKAALKRASAT